jgi:DNA-binding NtrC family response regulator
MSRGALSTLVVEDEDLIRMSVVHELGNAGCEVFEADNADDVVKVLVSHPKIEAVFTDIDMPGSMDGMKLAKYIKRSRPQMAILLTSGYLKDPKNDPPCQIAFFAKAYDFSQAK